MDSDLSDDADDIKARAGKRQRKKTLDKLFTNYGLEEGDEALSSPNLASTDPTNSNATHRGRSAKREPNGFTRTKSTGAPSSSKQKRKVAIKGKSPIPSQKRSKSKGRKSIAKTSSANARSKKAVNASRSANQKKKVSLKKKGKKKRKAVESPSVESPSLDSEEERESLWSAHHHSNGAGVKKRKRVQVAISGDDGNDSD